MVGLHLETCDSLIVLRCRNHAQLISMFEIANRLFSSESWHAELLAQNSRLMLVWIILIGEVFPFFPCCVCNRYVGADLEAGCCSIFLMLRSMI